MVRQLKIRGLQLAALSVLLGVWAYATGPGGVLPLLVPRIDTTFAALIDIVQRPSTWVAARVTVYEIVVATAIAITTGFAVGFLGSRTRHRLDVLEPLVAWGYMVPFVLFYPLLLLWLGLDEPSKIAYGAANGFFPMAFNTLKGFKSVDRGLVRTARAFGASDRQIEFTVKLPSALPVVLTGVRVGAALTVITVILAEMLASRRGLGFELSWASQSLRTAEAYAFIILIVAIVGVLHVIIQRFDIKRW